MEAVSVTLLDVAEPPYLVVNNLGEFCMSWSTFIETKTGVCKKGLMLVVQMLGVDIEFRVSHLQWRAWLLGK